MWVDYFLKFPVCLTWTVGGLFNTLASVLLFLLDSTLCWGSGLCKVQGLALHVMLGVSFIHPGEDLAL